MKEKKEAKKIRMSKMVVWYAMASIMIFMLLQFSLLLSKAEGFGDVFVVCWFTFWGYELNQLAGLKAKEIESPYKFPSPSSVLGNVGKNNGGEEAAE